MAELEKDDSAYETKDEKAADSPMPAPMQIDIPPIQSPVDESNDVDAESAIANLPAILNWKSAPLFTILGGWFSVMWRNVFYRILPPDLCYIPPAIVAILYVYLFYHSYFTEKPRIKSSMAISFLNCACAGILIGMCFNKNLKESKSEGYPGKGISPTVTVFLWIAIAVGAFGYYNFTPSGRLAKNYEYDAVDDSYRIQNEGTARPTNSETVKDESQQVTIPKTNTTITIPSGWGHRIASQDSDSADSIATLLIAPPYVNKDNTGIFIAAWNMSEYFEGEVTTQGLNEEFILERNRVNMETLDSETIDLVNLNGVDYWKVQTKGLYSDLPLTDTSYYCMDGPTMYVFTLSSLNETEETEAALAADFEDVVASAKYPDATQDQKSEPAEFHDEEAGVSFTLPDGWHSQKLNKGREYIRWKAYPNDNNRVGITYGVETDIAQSDASIVKPEDFRGIVSFYLEDCEDETVDTITLGDIQYYRAQGSGTYVDGDQSLPASMTILAYFDGDCLYMFNYYDFREERDSTTYYDDFISMVEGAKYE